MDLIKIRVAHSTEIPQGQARVFTLPDGEEIAIFHIDETFYAIKNECPHQGGPLAEGDIEGHCVTCPWHGWQFDLSNGTCISGGDDSKTFTLEEDAGVLYLKIPNPDSE